MAASSVSAFCLFLRRGIKPRLNSYIPLELLKSEQKQIAKELAAIDREISLHNISYQTAEYAIRSAVELAEDCGTAYRLGSDTYKRLMNQAIFSRFLVSNDLEGVCGVTAEFQPPFNVILEPFKGGVFAAVNRAKRNHDADLDKLIKKAERHIRSFFECGVSVFDNSESIETYSTFFKDKSSSKDFLVEPKGKQSNLTASPLTKGLPPSPYSMSHVTSVLSSEYHDVTTSPSSVR